MSENQPDEQGASGRREGGEPEETSGRVADSAGTGYEVRTFHEFGLQESSAMSILSGGWADFMKSSFFKMSDFTNLFGDFDISRSVGQAVQDLVKSNFEIGDMATGWHKQVLDMLSVVNPEYLASMKSIGRYASAPEPPFHSAGFSGPADYFGETEVVVDSFEKLTKVISKLTTKHPEMPMVWRGVRSAAWGFHSSLYRLLLERNTKRNSERKPTARSYPTEDQMVRAERDILRQAREFWRYDDMSALELFARVQHVGGPTRLIDVTRNPYIGAWFAVESDQTTDAKDARLFALGVKPIGGGLDHLVAMDQVGAARIPFWHPLSTFEARAVAQWGTGERRRVWFPPAYDQRILAQNAGFVFDGVPMPTEESYFKRESGSLFTQGDLLAAGSIYCKMNHHLRKVRASKGINFSPTFSIRITAGAKEDIRSVLERRFGYRASSIYPDAQGLSEYMRKTLSKGP